MIPFHHDSYGPPHFGSFVSLWLPGAANCESAAQRAFQLINDINIV